MNRNQRQNQLLLQGPQSMSDTDLLSIVLDAPGIARSLVESAIGWSDMTRTDLARLPYFRPTRVAQVLALVELSSRIGQKKFTLGQSIQCSEDVSAVYLPRLAGKKQEEFIVLSLDTKNRVIAEHQVGKGTLTGVEVHPREVFRELIRDGAARAIAVHNHPSGDPTPSEQDRDISRRLRDAGELVGIPVLDFIIVGSEGTTSFRDQGILR